MSRSRHRRSRCSTFPPSGSVVPAYNIPGVTQEVKFTPDILAGIFMGKIRTGATGNRQGNPKSNSPTRASRWCTAPTAAARPTLDGLSVEDQPGLAGNIGKGTSVKWPVGVGGKGNEGVAGMIRQLPGSLGYIELIYAVQNKITYGSVRNSSGNLSRPAGEHDGGCSGVKMPADFRVSITNSPARGISHCQLHLAADSDESDRQEQGQDPKGLSVLDTIRARQ